MDLIAMRELAVTLAREAGDFAVDEADLVRAEVKGAGSDVVTHVDHECERRIVAGILAQYPDHAVLGEESGWHGQRDAPYRWLVDPLDGTNNYVLGLRSYGVCITACHGRDPLVAVSHDSVGSHSYAAVSGGGATRDGVPITMQPPGPLGRETVSWLQGYAVAYEDEFRQRAFAALERSCKRVLRTLSPSIDWGLIATGRVAGMVAYRNQAWDLVGGALIACEAGAAMATARDGELVVVAHPTILAELVGLLDPT